MTRPVIGITTYVEPVRFTTWDGVTAALLPFNYAERVAAAGGQPVLLPPIGDTVELLSKLDGVLVSGGGDIDPARYGEERHPAVDYVREFRDEAEFALTRAVLEADMPFLGICRGQQVLNVVRGGSLFQHLPEVAGHTDHSPGPGRFGRAPVRIAETSRLAGLTGTTQLTPAHYHHQAIDRLGDGLTPVAWADDGTIEAVELAERRFVLGVQWHPEIDDDCGLFAGFIAAAAASG